MTAEWRTLLNTIREWEIDDTRWPDVVRHSELLLIQMITENVDNGAVDSAMILYNTVPWHCFDSTLRELQIRWMLRLGRILDRFGRKDSAHEIFNHAAEIDDPNIPPRLTAIALLESGELARRQGNLARAHQAHHRALEIARKANLDRETADALNNLAILAIESGQLPKADELLRECLITADALCESRLIGHIYNNLGVIYCMKNEFQHALSEFLRAIPCREKSGDQKGLSETYHNISMTYKDLGNREKASEYLEKGLSIARRLNDRGQEANILLTRVELLILSGDDCFALSLAEEVADLQSRLQDLPGLAECHKLMGMIYRQREDWVKASTCLEKSVATFRSLGFTPGEAESLKELGMCARKRGQHDDAVACYKKSLELFISLGNKIEQEDIGKILNTL